jgi:23S rRNA pseudouridine1911/1915/1917 synthase
MAPSPSSLFGGGRDEISNVNADISHYQFSITADEAGRRLDEFLWSRLGGLSRMRIANLIRAGACTINRQAERAGYHVAEGDLVELALGEAVPTSMEPEPIPLDIVYEDQSLLVLVKPAGMLVHPTRQVKKGTLSNALAYHLNQSRIADGGFRIDMTETLRPGLVHRLDRATSGLMVVTKTPRALSVLSRHFHKRLVEKRYLAIVHGAVSEDEGAIRAPIGRDDERRPQWCVMESGREAETRFRVRERRGPVTLLELEPVTGRTNQLRIHCAFAGHPIVGDEIYCEISNSKSQIPNRLCLHAWRLAFHHPADGRWMEFVSPLPDELKTAL